MELTITAKDKVSPCFGEGSGLKQVEKRRTQPDVAVSPCFGEGSGLKLILSLVPTASIWVSPCFGEGSGLKLIMSALNAHHLLSPLALVRGAD